MKRGQNPDNRLLTRAEVAEIFQVSPSTVTRWAEAGKLPTVKTLGGHRRYEAGVVMELARRFSTIPSKETTLLEKEVSMEKTVINVPAMYGDHHVLEVRRILLTLPGVEAVNASSCFQMVEVTYDPTRTDVDELTDRLDQAGYLEVLPVSVEKDVTAYDPTTADRNKYFRHTTAFEQAKYVISFAQDVHHAGPVLWPCPGVGLIKAIELEKEASHA